jgi:hypothetical protein
MAAARSLMMLHLRAGRFAAAGRWAWRRLRRVQGAQPAGWRQKQAEAWVVLAISAGLSGRRRLAQLARRQAMTRVGRAGRTALRRKLWSHAVAGLVVSAALGEAGPVQVARRGQSPLQRLLRFACARLDGHTSTWPNRADAFHHLALCRQTLGEVQAAAAANQTALALNPRYSDAIALRDRLQHPHQSQPSGSPRAAA